MFILTIRNIYSKCCLSVAGFDCICLALCSAQFGFLNSISCEGRGFQPCLNCLRMQTLIWTICLYVILEWMHLFWLVVCKHSGRAFSLNLACHISNHGNFYAFFSCLQHFWCRHVPKILIWPRLLTHKDSWHWIFTPYVLIHFILLKKIRKKGLFCLNHLSWIC